MRTTTLILAVILLGLTSCNRKKKSDDIANYAYSSEIKLSPILQESVGSWIEEGLDCYGIIAMYTDNDELVNAKYIKAKTIAITEKAIKMKALETVTLAPKIGCTKLGLEAGETWWENRGDLFQTKEEALLFIKQLKTKEPKKKNNRFTVD